MNMKERKRNRRLNRNRARLDVRRMNPWLTVPGVLHAPCTPIERRFAQLLGGK